MANYFDHFGKPLLIFISILKNCWVEKYKKKYLTYEIQINNQMLFFVIHVNMRVASIAEKIHNTCKNDMYSKCLDDLYNENSPEMCVQSYEAIY